MVRVQIGGVRKTAYAKTEAEARAKLKALQQQALLDGGFTNAHKRTLADLCAAWLESANVRESTREYYERAMRLYVLPALGKVRLDKLTPERIEALYRKLDTAKARKAHLALRRCLAVAVRWRWLAANPCDRVQRPAHKPRKPELWTLTQLAAFLGVAKDYPLLMLLAATGMRLGEALALRWRDVAPDGSVVTVRESAAWLRGRWVFQPPKTAAGVRIVRLPYPAIEALARLRAQAGDVSDDRLLFEGKKHGQPVSYAYAHKMMRRACARAGVPRIRLHDLRHLHASLLLAEGVPVPEVAKRLGHASAQVTMSIYAHALGSQAASVAAMERVLKEAKREG